MDFKDHLMNKLLCEGDASKLYPDMEALNKKIQEKYDEVVADYDLYLDGDKAIIVVDTIIPEDETLKDGIDKIIDKLNINIPEGEEEYKADIVDEYFDEIATEIYDNMKIDENEKYKIEDIYFNWEDDAYRLMLSVTMEEESDL